MMRHPGLSVLDGRFMVVEQAMATPNGREDGAAYLKEFIEEMKQTGKGYPSGQKPASTLSSGSVQITG